MEISASSSRAHVSEQAVHGDFSLIFDVEAGMAGACGTTASSQSGETST